MAKRPVLLDLEEVSNRDLTRMLLQAHKSAGRLSRAAHAAQDDHRSSQYAILMDLIDCALSDSAEVYLKVVTMQMAYLLGAYGVRENPSIYSPHARDRTRDVEASKLRDLAAYPIGMRVRARTLSGAMRSGVVVGHDLGDDEDAPLIEVRYESGAIGSHHVEELRPAR